MGRRRPRVEPPTDHGHRPHTSACDGSAGIQFVVATAASYVLKRWLTSGGVLAAKIPPTPYPDIRYQTRIAWWDRLTFANHAQPRQLSAYLADKRAMTPRPDFAGDAVLAAAPRLLG